MTIKLPVAATVGDVQHVFHKELLRSNEPYPSSLCFDLSETRFMEVSTLLYLIAVFSDRASRKLETSLALPVHKDVRDFLRRWKFPEALAKATRRPFSSITRPEDRKYFGENAKGAVSKYRARIPDDSIAFLEEADFFSIVSFSPAEVSRTRLVTEESKRWESELIRSVLAKHLDGPESYMASRIIYESMTNAARHSTASLIQTSSRFTAPHESQRNNKGHFTICFWDNGKSMVDTLSSAIADGRPIRAQEMPDLYKEHLLVLKDDDDNLQKEYNVSSGMTPGRESPEYEILFATTFPGITRDAEGKEHEVHEELKAEGSALSLPGMGLHVLLNAAINVFSGSISFRTKTFFMNVKAAPKRSGAAYRAKIQLFSPGKIPAFQGNLVTIRLPLRLKALAA